MLILVISCILPPAASTTVLRLRNTCSYCPTRSPSTKLPSASLPVWPDRKRSCPPVTRTPWLKPRGCASSGGLIIVFCMNTYLYHLRLSGSALPRLKLLIELTVIFTHEHQCLRLCLGFDGGDEIHVEFRVNHTLGH